MSIIKLLCSGYLRENHVSGCNDIALILAGYIHIDPLTIQVFHLYSDSSSTNSKQIEFYFPSSLTMKKILKTIVNEFNPNKFQGFDYKIFRECGVELQSGDIKNLHNNDVLFITNTNPSEKYKEFEQSSYIADSTGEKSKLVHIGLFGDHIGKSSLAARFTTGSYYEDYDMMYEDTYRKYIMFDHDQQSSNKILLEIMPTDSGLCAEYGGLTDTFMRQQDMIVFVFAIDDRHSFDGLDMYYKRFVKQYNDEDFHDYEKPPIILVGNKADLRNDDDKQLENKDLVSMEEALKLLKTFNGIRYIEVSAKTGYNVDEMFIGAAILTDNKKFQQYNKDTQTNGKSKCCQIL